MKQKAQSRYRLSAGLSSRIAGKAAAAWADRRGVAAFEFGFFAVFLSIALANVTDVSIYITSGCRWRMRPRLRRRLP